MHWRDEIRAPRVDELDEEVELPPQEIKLARGLTDDFQPEEFHDEQRAALEDVIAKQVQGEKITFVAEAEPAKVFGLMQAASQRRGCQVEQAC
jgi:DNA end-binding protein Ku